MPKDVYSMLKLGAKINKRRINGFPSDYSTVKLTSKRSRERKYVTYKKKYANGV